jgi:hypothetical protein
MSRANDVEHVLLRLANQAVRVRINEGETWTGSPMAEKTGFDVLSAYLAFEEGIILEKDHSCNDVSSQSWR